MDVNGTLDRRRLLKLAGGAAALGALGSVGLSGPAHSATNGFGLTITDQGSSTA
jgi:hypothetical protein